MSSRLKSAFWGSASSQFFLLITMLVNMVLIPLLLQYLKKEEYGVALFVMQLLGYLLMFDFGLGNALARYLSMYRGNTEENIRQINRIISTGFFVYLFLGCLLSFSGIVCSGPFSELIGLKNAEGKKMFFMLSVFIGIRFPLFSIEGILFAHQKQTLSNFIIFISGLLNSLLTFVLIFSGYGIVSFAYSFMASSLLTFSLKLYFITRHYSGISIKFKYFDRLLIKEFYSFGFFTFINFLALQLVLHSDRLIIGPLVSFAAVSVYTITAKLPEIGMVLINKISENALPALVEKSSKEGFESLKHAYRRLMKVVAILATAGFWLVVSLNKYFISLWVGNSFYAGQTITTLIAVFFTGFSLTYVSTLCLYSAGKVKEFSICSIIQAMVNIGLSVFLAPTYGLYGVLAATLAAAIIPLIYVPALTISTFRFSLIEYFWQPLIKPVLLVSLAGITSYILADQFFGIYKLSWFSLFTLASFSAIFVLALPLFILLKSELLRFFPALNSIWLFQKK